MLKWVQAMRYQHEFTVAAPLETVAEFHSRSASMGAITPPPVVVRVHQAPERLQEGDRMDFTMWLGPLPVRWLAQIEDVSPEGFTDRQVRGPFERWVHRHTFVPLESGNTLVRDEIEYRPKRHPFWGPVGFLMGLNLPVLFAFRGWKTRNLLESRPAKQAAAKPENAP